MTIVQSDREALVKAAAERLRKRHDERGCEGQARRVRAQEFARGVARRLGEADERVQKIIGFGSTFEMWRTYRLDSDIDLGFIGGDWFTLTAAIAPSEFDVSLVELKHQNDEFRRYVLEHGEVLERLRSELSQDLAFIEGNCGKNREMTQRIERTESEDEFLYAALGYTIHNVYNAIESYFFRIAKFFENELGDADWHRSLVDRMTLTIDGVRPAVIDLELARTVDELCRFRHLFRNLYKAPLIPAQVRFANDTARGIDDRFRECHERFDHFLTDLKRELER